MIPQKRFGPPLILAGLTASAIETLQKEDMLLGASKTQARKVKRWCDEAIQSVDTKCVTDATVRKIDRASKEFIRCFAKHFTADKLFAWEFVVARLYACNYLLNYLVCRHSLGSKWKYLDQTGYTFLKMIWEEVCEYEDKFQAVADDFFREVICS
jgi:hypothetical protein